jgi:hypothetical protein
MFEVTPEDIALLNDTDLRALVGHLCESEARSRGLSPSAVTWGGDQNATDDGLDVHVELPAGTVIDGFIPRAEAGFQVKRMDMPPAAIRTEMRPSGTAVRPVIQELADRGGAYIIVTSSFTSYRMLKARLRAMTAAVNDVGNRDALALNFYDRTRLASWIRSHPGMVLWTREKIGKSIPGWRPYGPWAYPPEGVDAEYLLDDRLRVQTGKAEDDGGLAALKGIQHLRNLLKEPGKVIRLVGLSGVGKTRFVQALFDSHVGEHSVDPSLAVYTNMSDGPNPQPLALATNLIAAGTRAILIVDNCTPELHRQLSELCRTTGSKLNLLTVEYDVRDHEPEGTDVLRLEPSSEALIEKLIGYRFPELSQVEVRTIAKMSDGNARVAIALAGTLGKNEVISGFPDDELFRRLFQQKHRHDDSLLRAAQALSLVYSFHGEDVSDGNEAELVRLGGMIGRDAAEMFRHTAELERRDLVQRRSVWRALLPHALANRLARLALQDFAPSIIEAQLVNGASPRLWKSFSRRLGYLSDSDEAVSIVTRWLAANGLLAEVANFNDLGKAIFESVAPVAPEAVLSALERALLGPGGDEALPRCGHFARLLRLISYDAPLFERCSGLILKLALAADEDDNKNEARNIFISLFFIYLSGTHATIEQRLRVLRPLLFSDKSKEINLGVGALKSVLEAWHFGSAYGFEFGSRARNFGYRPATRAEFEHWFGTALNVAQEIACSDALSAPQVRDAIAEKLSGLWTGTGMHDLIAQVCQMIAAKTFWPNGWIAVRQVQHDADDLASDPSARLSSLEEILRPNDLVQKVRTIVLSNGHHSYDVADFEGGITSDLDERIRRTTATVGELGKAVAVEPETLETLIGELLTTSGEHLWLFGCGLAEGCQTPNEIWSRIRRHVASTPSGICNPQVMRGFLHGLNGSNPQLTDELLEQAVEDEPLGPFSPLLETAVEISERGVKRLMRSLGLGKAPLRYYGWLMYGRATDPIPAQEMKALLMEIASKPNGLDIAMEILYMRLHSARDRSETYPPELIEVGRELLETVTFDARKKRQNRQWGEIAKACLTGESGSEPVARLCRKLKKAMASHYAALSYNDDLMLGLFTAQPRAALDAICGGDDAALESGLYLLDDMRRMRHSIFSVIPESELLAWCDSDSSRRYPAVAARINISTNIEVTEGKHEWAKIALALLQKAPDRIEVVKRFIQQIRSVDGWGSRASIIEANAKLLDDLERYPDPAVVAFAAQEKVRLAEHIEKEKRSEMARDRNRNERFE